MPGLGVSAGAATLGPAGAAMVPIAGQAAQMGAERVTRKAAERASGIVAGGGNVALPNVAPTMRAIERLFHYHRGPRLSRAFRSKEKTKR